MLERRAHRGPDPRDEEAFSSASIPRILAAVSDLSWLLSRGYSVVSALKLVGDRWTLTERQRMAVRRATCSGSSRNRRELHRVSASELRGRLLLIDGFNVLTTVEAALGGAVILACQDGRFRDLAGIHGNYRKVAETRPAIDSIARTLDRVGPSAVLWLLDRPISNSGRLRALLLEASAGSSRSWSVELVNSPDPMLKSSEEVVATADSAILDTCQEWFNLAREVVEEISCPVRIVGLEFPMTDPPT